MPTEGPSARVEVFLDHQNFYHGLRQDFPDSGGSCDFPALVREVARGRKLVAWNHYSGTVDANLEPQKFGGQEAAHRYLRGCAERGGIALNMKLRPLIYPPGYPRSNRGPYEKGIDALIVQDIIVGAFDNRYDVAVLLSGDRDFYCVLEFLNERFPHVAIETLYPNCRRHLREHVPDCFDRAKVLDKHVYKRIARR